MSLRVLRRRHPRPDRLASRPRPTYERGEGGGLYLDLLPAEEGNPEDRDKPLARIASRGTQDFGGTPANAFGTGFFRFRISSADGKPINRTIRLGGPHAQDFSPLYPDTCEDEPCRPAGVQCSGASCYCSRSVCQFGMYFLPSAVGPRSAMLFIGDTLYAYLTGIGLPELREEQEGSTSSSTSVTTSGRTSTSSSSGSTVRPPSTTATHSPATS
jgi:hypothetical protein